MREIDNIADEWIEAWSNEKIAAVGEGVSDSKLDWDLPRDEPDKCLDTILVVLEKIRDETDNRLIGVLAAGPLEDLLHENGEKIVNRVEEHARKIPYSENCLMVFGIVKSKKM